MGAWEDAEKEKAAAAAEERRRRLEVWRRDRPSVPAPGDRITVALEERDRLDLAVKGANAARTGGELAFLFARGSRAVPSSERSLAGEAPRLNDDRDGGREKEQQQRPVRHARSLPRRPASFPDRSLAGHSTRIS